MKKKILSLVLFFPLLLTSCNQTTTDEKTKLTLIPNEQYLISNSIEQENSKVLSLRKDAPDQVDYAFSITKTETDELDLVNPNDLIIGRERILLQPLAVTYAVEDGVVTDEETSRMTPEQTETNFTPIIEMSGSGYGNDDISLDTYDAPQIRTCYAISNSEGILQSEYYDVSIIIEDSLAPTSVSDVLNLETRISYKNASMYDSGSLNDFILGNYTDNDSNTVMSVKYFTDDTYTSEMSADEVISGLRNNENLVLDGVIQSLPVYYKVYDDNGNASNNGLAYVKLYDDVKPQLLDKNNEVVTQFGFGTRIYYPDASSDLKNYLKENFKIVDEVNGELSFDNAEVSITSNGASLRISDSNRNELYILDTESKLTSDFVSDSYYVWYPEGSSEEVNPERGLQYTFVLNEETNEYEIEIVGPNLATGQYKKDWLGTNGEGHIQIPQTITFYDHEYKVTVIGYQAFWLASGITSISSDVTGQDLVYDFSNTYLRLFDPYMGFVHDDTRYTILDSLNDSIVVMSNTFILQNENSAIFISNKVAELEIGSISVPNIYLEISEDERAEKESEGYFKVYRNASGHIENAWYNHISVPYFCYDYTLEQFKTEFNIL